MTLRHNRPRARAAVHLPSAGVPSAGAFTPDALSVGARHLEVGRRLGVQLRGLGFPPGGAPGLAGPAADLSRPLGRRAACRADRPGHRRGAVEETARQARVRAAAHRRARPPVSTRRSRPPPRTPTTCPPASRGVKASCSGSGCTSPSTPPRSRRWPTRWPRCGRCAPRSCWTRSTPPIGRCRAGCRPCRWGWT